MFFVCFLVFVFFDLFCDASVFCFFFFSSSFLGCIHNNSLFKRDFLSLLLIYFRFNRLIELETQLSQRWKKYSVVAGVAAVVFLFAWPVLAVRMWERARTHGPQASAFIAAPILTWISSLFGLGKPPAPPK